jgi:hypothetical protein
VVEPQAPASHAPVTALVSLTILIAAVVTLLAAPRDATAGGPTRPSAPLTIDARPAGSSDRPRVVQTDAHHAILAQRAGYRVRIMRPTNAGYGRAAVLPSPSTYRGVQMTILLIGAALLGSAVGALVVGAGRARLSGSPAPR